MGAGGEDGRLRPGRRDLATIGRGEPIPLGSGGWKAAGKGSGSGHEQVAEAAAPAVLRRSSGEGAAGKSSWQMDVGDNGDCFVKKQINSLHRLRLG
uniref:Uncharacterized protein n=1 Tax=Oryza brachyantha TaxID=4533 RepID=J3L8K0_ORYBR